MEISDFVSSISIPTMTLSLIAGGFIGAALATKKNRQEAIGFLKSRDLGTLAFSSAARMWSAWFTYFFGDRIFSKRQMVTIPIYTISVSLIFFAIWISYLYLFQNPIGELSGELSPHFKQGASDYFMKGIIAAIIIDFITIQLTKRCIRVGGNSGYGSPKFLLLFIGTLAAGYFIFSLAVFIFRVDDMVRLYMAVAPNDPLPIIKYEPIENIKSSLSFFQPQTLIHWTSNGVYSTYFMPEPLLFYNGVASQLTLIFIALMMFAVGCIYRLKKLTVNALKTIGTRKANAYTIYTLVTSVVISVFILLAMVVRFILG